MNAALPESAMSAPENYTNIPVGEILRRTRVHYGQTLEDVSNFLRIRASQLEALEKGEIEKLPGRVYAIGYVRTYAEYLGLDGEKMIQLFKAQSDGRTVKPELHFPVSASESKSPNLYIIGGSVAALIVIGIVWALISAGGKDNDIDIAAIPNVPTDIQIAAGMDPTKPEDMSQPAVTTSIQVPDEAAVASVDATIATAENATAATTDAMAPVAPAAEAKKEITINVKEKSWVEVRDKKGETILSRILKPGEVFIVPEENYGLRLDTGNAGGLELLVNGQPLPPLGKQGDILRGLVLDGNQLVQKFEPAGGAASQ